MKKAIKYFALLTALAALFAVMSVTALADVPEADPFNMALTFSPETQLVVYVDGEWSDALSDTYGYGESVTLTAPDVENKAFAYWEADGSVIGYSKELKLTVNANTTLFAVYADDPPAEKPVAGFTSITCSADGSSIAFNAITSGESAGIVYSTMTTGNNLEIGGSGVTNIEAVKLTNSITTIPQSVIDGNNCCSFKLKPESADTVYHVRAYVTVNGKTTYGDVKDVKLSELQSGVSMVANLEGFEFGINDDLAKLTEGMHTVTYYPNGGIGATITQAYKGTSVVLRSNTFTREGYAFRGWSTTPTGNAAYTDTQSVTFSENITLYAVWGQEVSYTVTFQVMDGAWDDGTTADKTVTLFGLEGDALKLSANQIPAVGTKPGEGHKVGTWDTVPDTDTPIAENMTYTYTYAPVYTVTFNANGGSVTPSSAVTGTDGKLSSLPTPTAADGASFDGWYDAASGGTQITPDFVYTTDATLYAHWSYYRSGDEDSNEAPPAVTVSGNEESVSVTVRVSGDTAVITGADMDDALNAQNAGAVTIDVSSLGEEIHEVAIPSAVLEAIAAAAADENKGADGLEVKLPTGAVSFDAAALASIAEQMDGGDLRLNLDNVKVAELSGEQQEAVQELAVEAVLDAYLTSGGRRVSDLGGGQATVKIPYALKEGQRAQGLVVWYVAEDGSKTRIPSAYDGKNVVFTVSHFSNYVIAYDAERASTCPRDEACPMSAFSDLDMSAWYHDGIHTALEQGIMSGMGNGRFGPDVATTRGQMAQILYNLEGKPEGSGAPDFTDTDPAAWYAPAVLWAKESGAMSGYGNDTFGPNAPLTREQLVTIMHNYAAYKGADVSQSADLTAYTDADSISPWARTSMGWAVGAGLVSGRAETTLAPGDTATRAEIATILSHYLTDAERGDTRSLRLGTSPFSVQIPKSYVEGDVTEEERADDMIAYYHSDDTLMDFDIYQFSKEGYPQTLAEYAAQEAADYDSSPVSREIQGIPTFYYLAREEYDGVLYDTQTYIMDSGEDYVEIAFWLDGETARDEAEAIIRSLRMEETPAP